MPSRVTIPGNPEDLLALAKSVLKKHNALGKDSPLKMIKLGKIGPVVDKALENHKQAERLRREWKEHTRAGIKKSLLLKTSYAEAETCSKVFIEAR